MGKTEDTVDMNRINKKGCFLTVLEQLHIYVNKKQSIHLSRIYRDTDNPVYNVVIAHAPQHCSTTQLTVWQNSTHKLKFTVLTKIQRQHHTCKSLISK